MQEDHWDLKLNINGQHTFLLNQEALCSFSGRLRKMVRVRAMKESKRSKLNCISLRIMDFPGGPSGFELIARFCYNHGTISINPSNISILHCSATYLDMTEAYSAKNLLTQVEAYLNKLFYWGWKDIMTSLKSCESVLDFAESSGLITKLTTALILKISANSDTPPEPNTPIPSSSSATSSPDTSAFRSSSSAKATDSSRHHCLTKEWFFDDLVHLHPLIVHHIIKGLSACGDGNNIVVTRFLMHYLKSESQRRGVTDVGCEYYTGLSDTLVHGVVNMGRGAFSCKMLFWVRRVVSGFKLSEECKGELEKLMGALLDQASLDELLVCGNGAVYDVGLVVRLVKVFIDEFEGGEVELNRMRKVGKLVDKYLREVSPDPSLKAVSFIELAEILPDHARDCFDGVYRALEIYLESHPKLTVEDRSRLCQCLNYEKLTLEACKDFAKNPWIPPREAVQALILQQSKLTVDDSFGSPASSKASKISNKYKESKESSKDPHSPSSLSYEKETLLFSMKFMEGKLVGQLPKLLGSKILINNPSHLNSKAMSRLC